MTRQRPPRYFWKKIAAASPLMPPPTATRSYLSPVSKAAAGEIVGAVPGSRSPAPARRAPLRKSRREIGSLIPRRFSSTTRLWLQRSVRRARLESEPVRRERHTVGYVSKAVTVGRAELQLIFAPGFQRDPVAERRAR